LCDSYKTIVHSQIYSTSEDKFKGQAINNITTKTPAVKNLKSIILMITGMGCLTLADLLIKIASQTLPLGQVMIVFGAGSITVFLGLMRIKGESVRLSPFTNPAVLLRNIGDLIAINGMCLALVFVPISTIGAVIQTVPLMVTAAAALFLRERVGTRRWLAIVVGFLGTLFVIQPGAGAFDITTTLVLIAAVGMALRDISTKLVRENFSTLLLSSYTSVLFIISGGVLLIISGGAIVPDIGMIAILAAMIISGSLGFFFTTKAVRLGDVSVVIPFRYTRLLFSVAAGILILGEQINAMMLFGSALTILSGLYIWRREIVLQN
jgi:drug/metabolite transporter (DMT)-like permease